MRGDLGSILLWLRQVIKTLSIRSFMTLDQIGIHIMPKHYYSSLPDRTWLRRNPQAWRGRASMTGIDWNLDQQTSWLSDICAEHMHETYSLYDSLVKSDIGLGYGPIEARVLYCFIRSTRPRRIIEIGGGISTAVMSRAATENMRRDSQETHITSIEPYPHPALVNLPGVEHVQSMGQSVPLVMFDQLEQGDLLFIDSTHTVRTGSEVIRIYTEIIPRLRPGINIHVHDIYLPYLHSRNILNTFFDWQETALLLALLMNNSRLRVSCSLPALHYDRTDALRKIVPAYVPQENDGGLRTGDIRNRHFPSSLWLRTV